MDPVTIATIGSSVLGGLGGLFGSKGKQQAAPTVTPFQAMPQELRSFAQQDLFPAIQQQFAQPFQAMPMARYDVAPTDMGYSPEMAMLQGFADAVPQQQAPMPQQPQADPMGMDVSRGMALLQSMGYRSPQGVPQFNGQDIASYGQSDLAALGRAQALVPASAMMGPRPAHGNPLSLLSYAQQNPDIRSKVYAGLDTASMRLPFERIM